MIVYLTKPPSPLPLPLGEVPQCAHWGGEGPTARIIPSQSPSCGGASSPRGRAKSWC